MGIRGPIAKPKGTDRRRGSVPVGRPDAPDELIGEAAAEWSRVVPVLDAAGMLATIDRAALSAYCRAWARMVEATNVLDTEGLYVSEPVQTARGEVVGKRLRIHPAQKVQSEAYKQWIALLTQLGLSPAARARMNPTAPGPSGGGALADILNRVHGAR